MNFPKRVEAVEQDVIDLKQIIEYYYQNDQQQQRSYQPAQYQNQRQQAPQYQEPDPRCWDYANDGYEYEYDCNTGNWL